MAEISHHSVHPASPFPVRAELARGGTTHHLPPALIGGLKLIICVVLVVPLASYALNLLGFELMDRFGLLGR